MKEQAGRGLCELIFHKIKVIPQHLLQRRVLFAVAPKLHNFDIS
jgi:hypothetical protein